MKILIVGGDYEWSIERYYLKYLQEMGVVSSLFPAQNLLYSYLKKDLFNKVKHRVGLSNIYDNINLHLKEQIRIQCPSVLWVFKGMEVSPATLLYAKRKGIKLVNYNPDNPFIFTGRGSGNKYVKDSINIYDLHFTYNHEIYDELKNRNQKYRTFLLPFGFELPIEFDSTVNFQSQAENNKACFVGNPDKYRATWIQSLLDKGIKIDLYGNQWYKFINHPNALIKGPVYGIDLWEKLRLYRVQLNILRIHNLNSHNMRSFEIPAVGGIQLAPSTKDHQSFFIDGESIFLYKEVKDAAEKIQVLTSLRKNEALTIRKNAYDLARSHGYSYFERTKQAYESILTL